MKFKVSQIDFKNAINQVIKGIGSKGNNPLLSNILLIAKDKGIILFSTDSTLSIEKKIKCSVVETGKVLLPGEILKKYISQLPEGTIYFKTENDKAKMKSESSGKVSKMSLRSFNPYDFPERKNIKGKQVKVDQTKFKELLQKVSIAIADDNENAVLNGMCVQSQKGKLIGVGTNTFKLSYYESNIDIEKDINLIIGKKIASILISLLDEGKLKIVYNGNTVKFVFGNTRIHSALITGEYPDYEHIIPDELDVLVEIEKDNLKEVLKRVTILDDQNAVLIETNDGLEFYNEGFSGDITDKIECKPNQDITIAIDGSYILDFISKAEDDVVQIKGEDSQTPLIIKEQNNNDWLYIIMPLRAE